MLETRVWSLDWEDPLEKGNGNPLQYSCLENPTDRDLQAIVDGISKELDMIGQLNNNNIKCGRWNLPHLYFEAANTLIEKEVKESFSFLHHCFLWRLNCIFYWNIVALQCCVSFPVQQSGSVMYILYPPTPVFLSGELHGQRSMVGYSPWSHKELATIEAI